MTTEMMSTKIDDLPMPDPVLQKESKNTSETILKSEEIGKKQEEIIETITPKFSLFSLFRKEFNEENLFLLVLFFIISISDVNRYLVNIPIIGNNFTQESWSFVLLKSFAFLLVFIIGKAYILPKIQI